LNTEREAARYRSLHRSWLSVLERIRSLDGLRDFLLPTPFDKLQKAAARGTIVILNASDSGCAALTVILSNVAHVSLPRCTFKSVGMLAKMIQTVLGPTGFSREDIQHSVEREIVIMKLIDHPNILRLYDVWETSTDLYLIMEYVEGGELFDYLCNNSPLSTSEALGYFPQLISAVHYCHQFNIAHRDLKPENLLLDVNKNIKVADFGLAAYGANDGMLNTFCGSPHYAAPEVISGLVYKGSCSDTWSCGIILHALLLGSLPFEAEDCQILKQQIMRAEFQMPDDIDPLAKDLVSKMLEKDVIKRITISEVLQHPFYTSQKPKKLDHVIPSLDDIACPIGNLSNIDADIFANLRTLWPDTPEKELAACLRNDEKNWQRGIYHLLVEYPTRHLEDYDEEQEMLRLRAARRRKMGKRRKAPSHGIQRAASMVIDLGPSSSLPPRAAPPTPRRASGRECNSNSTLSAPPPTNLPHDGDTRSEAHSSTLSPTSPLSPIWAALDLAPIDVPELEDENIQQFFYQIVEHLNIMQQRTMIAGGASPLPGATHDMTRVMAQEQRLGL
jgi:serine/threonine-protein kinase HSL1 (negative regulator of Swe1 kinase)